MEASMRHAISSPARTFCAPLPEVRQFVIETQRPGCEPKQVVRWCEDETEAALEAVKDADGAAVNVWPLNARLSQAMFVEQFITGAL
jgi:hypothetical protein